MWSFRTVRPLKYCAAKWVGPTEFLRSALRILIEDSKMKKVLVIGLDGYELSLADTMINLGQLPSLARIREKSARFLLDHSYARDTGLAWEHVSSGLSPKDAERWSAVSFDKENYAVWQGGSLFAPFPSKLRANTIVFDFPYFDLSKAS